MYDLLRRTFRTPHGHPVSMWYRDDTNDYNTLNASLDEDEYQLPSGLSGVALDIGGYLGSVGIALALDNTDLRVIIVEPVPSNQHLIKRNIAENGIGERVLLIKGAVGRGLIQVAYGWQGTESSRHHTFVGNSSLFVNETDAQTVTYTGLSLESLVALSDGEVAFMKVDIEGGEYDFLDDPAVAKVQTIVGEYHLGRRHDLETLLEGTHRVRFDTSTPDGVGGFRAERY